MLRNVWGKVSVMRAAMTHSRKKKLLCTRALAQKIFLKKKFVVASQKFYNCVRDLQKFFLPKTHSKNFKRLLFFLLLTRDFGIACVDGKKIGIYQRHKKNTVYDSPGRPQPTIFKQVGGVSAFPSDSCIFTQRP